MEEALSQSFGEEHKDLKALFPVKGLIRKTHWVFQTSVIIYGQLRRRQKLTIDWENSKKILECQKMPHVTISRTHSLPLQHRKDISWLLHRESHNYRLQQQRPHCINCRKHNYKYKMNYRTDHASIDHTCPIYAAKTKSITKNTIY
ncbi:hypothetical protein AVEN_244875-1 [Araneus ventricosus]|uniref:Uncharacterized protein n=1 Tax=Araneus ventricosus TaxID=182803 RepID=A0A4Y2KYX5_ARAVE|nr:hypothetical protein AVEN_244875-1 [Araneus ventricosus]